jgi:hypothetical protein
MKNIQYSIGLLLLLALVACGGGVTSDQDASEGAVRTLTVGETQTSFISVEGEVDTYRLRAAETNRFLHIHCEERTSGSNVDLLVTVFEEVNGNRVRVFGKHKPDGASIGADLDLWIFIDTPKDLFITVRDLLDDDASVSIPYFLTATFEDSAEGNHNFSNAQSLTIGAAETTSDVIEEIGEVDCFTFAPTASGVYAVNVDHHKPAGGSPVQLAVSLYDENGNRIQRITDPYHVIRAYLTPESGPYFLIVEDSDSMDSDLGAPYDIAIEPIVVSEAQDNDVVEDATALELDAEDIYTAAGTIDYGCSSISPGHEGDQDWYRFDLGQVGGATTYHQVLMTVDGGETITGTTPFRVIVYNAEMTLVTSHDFAISAAAYQNQFRVPNGQYTVVVAAANPRRLDNGTNYRVRLEESDSNDAIETTDDNTANSAIALAGGVSTEGFVSYHSDVDWYSLSVDTTSARILSVELEADASIVDYQLTVWRGVEMVKKVTDMDGSDGQTHLKTSILVPQDADPGTATYHFKISDAQNNEGSSIAYSITADSVPVATDPGGIAETGGQTPRYYGETTVEAAETAEVELEIFSSLQPHFKANTTWLDFRDPGAGAAGIVKTEPGDGTTDITFPWISGYVDYQDDRDFFQIDLGKLDPSGAETSWYYDVEVRLVVPSGSEVEYVWKLYRDSNRNAIIMDDPTSPDGYKACAGDTTPQDTAAEDITTPSGGDTFWIGSEWGEDAKFYFALSDFNYLRLPGTGALNGEPDNDWGYDAPYYFTITLTYHPGQAYPD